MLRPMAVIASVVVSAACVLGAAAFAEQAQAPAAKPQAKAKGAEIVIAPKWAKGDSRTYERVKSRRKLLNGKVVAEASGRGDVDVSVDEATKDGFLVRWVNRETKSDTPGAGQDALLQKVNQLVNGMVTLIEIDSEAKVKGVRNWKDAQKKSAAIVDLLSDPALVKNMDPKAAAQLKDQLMKMFGTKEQVEQLFLREPTLFFMPIGRSMTIGEPFTFKDQIANPLGGRPFPSRAKFTLSKYDAKTGQAVVNWDLTMDPEESPKILDESLKALAKRLGRTVPEAEAAVIKEMRIEDHAEFVVDTRTGWVERFSHTRSIKTGPNGQDDVLSMTLKKPANGRPL